MLTKNELIYRANLAEDAYPTNGIDDEKWLFSLRGVSPGLQTFSCNGTIGFIQPEKNGHAIISFRGTELSDIQDLITDLKVKPVPNRKGPGLVHEGVQEALHGVWPQILTLLGEMEVHSVTFVGHSLGGMLATLAAMWLYQDCENIAITGVTTFGSPPVGDGVFADALRSKLGEKLCDVVNGVDIVPRLITPWLMGFRRAGTVYYLPTIERRLILSPSLWLRCSELLLAYYKSLMQWRNYKHFSAPGIEHHSMTRYQRRLKELPG